VKCETFAAQSLWWQIIEVLAWKQKQFVCVALTNTVQE